MTASFRMGDKVVALEEVPGLVTKGKEYLVLYVIPEPFQRIEIRSDDGEFCYIRAKVFMRADPIDTLIEACDAED